MTSPDGPRRPVLSAVIACYRDAPAVPFMYQRLRAVLEKIGADYEIIFVNDGSPDNAREVLDELASQDPRVIVIHHSRNFGSQAAFTSGMRVSTGDAVVLLDGDLQDPPELIADFHRAWLEGYDIVYGVRVRRETNLLLGAAYKAFYRLFRATAYVRVPLDAGDFCLLDRRVVNVLNQMPETNRFVRGLRAWIGFRQTGVPYVRPERMFGRTTNNLLKNVGWARKAIVSFSYVPLDLITWFGFATVALSLLGIVAQVIIRLLFPSLAPSGFSTLIVLMLFLGGVQILSISIIGSYLAHIYDEVKRRPAYIVESTRNLPAAEGRMPANCREQRCDDGSGMSGPHFIEARRPARLSLVPSVSSPGEPVSPEGAP
jgi:glycosyltransferase involved in cell wall biosynthesis